MVFSLKPGEASEKLREHLEGWYRSIRDETLRITGITLLLNNRVESCFKILLKGKKASLFQDELFYEKISNLQELWDKKGIETIKIVRNSNSLYYIKGLEEITFSFEELNRIGEIITNTLVQQ